MASCTSTTKTPGSPTSGSGYASRLAANAVRCDQARLLSRLQSSSCCPNTPQSTKSAVYASILEQRAAKGTECFGIPGSTVTSSAQVTSNYLALPTTGVPSSVLTQRIIQQTLLISTDATNPSSRFSTYNRVIVPLVCPIATINNAIPKPSLNGPCRVWPGS
jgi:hypothetical protein